MRNMQNRKGGDRVLNKTPLWVIDGLETIETPEPLTTSDVLLLLDQFKSNNEGRYRNNNRYYDHSPSFLPFVLKRLGWVNLSAGERSKAALWLKGPSHGLRS